MALSKPARPVTKAGATSYSFCHSDAIGFPRLLPPVRKIGLGRRALAGLMPSDKLDATGLARFESSLERDFFVLLEFNSDVIRWDPQPVRLEVGPKGRTYVPDVLVSFIGPSRDVRDVRRILYEVKYRDDLRKKWSEYKPRLRAGYRYAKSCGWDFKIITEREIRAGGLLWNAKFLLPYRNDSMTDADEIFLMARLRAVGQTTVGELMAACSDDPWKRARLLTGFWHLVAHRRIGTDLRLKLSMSTVIWPDE